ncbi:helix-turn-helix domain-containing protein [Geosporobacter subterraneus]|uniref:helix-turn-helix domain-containing protein n=1 Tax=Geosporobacter subterraneus TaxID=390806 RepID=UPI0016791D0A|nr:helix-turn-helix transcriptional regulator [Geosporobacter subterraneus]
MANLLIQGKIYRTFADELYISDNTVKFHVRNIYSKLNIQSRTELIDLMIDRQGYPAKVAINRENRAL